METGWTEAHAGGLEPTTETKTPPCQGERRCPCPQRARGTGSYCFRCSRGPGVEGVYKRVIVAEEQMNVAIRRNAN